MDPSRHARLRRYWDRQAGSYDRQMLLAERRLFAGTREWICSQAGGTVLEVAVGTGLNLPHYPAEVDLHGVEWSGAMLDVARRRARELGRPADLRRGDAQALSYPDAAFDAVVCTFSLCCIPDDRAALREMTRVLRPGGLLLLADHVVPTAVPLRALLRLVDLVSVPLYGEHMCRRPVTHLDPSEFAVEKRERFKLGAIERVRARKQ